MKKNLLYILFTIFMFANMIAQTASVLKYGDKIRLQHVPGSLEDNSTNYYLKGLPGVNYTAGSKQEMVVGENPSKGNGSIWILRGAHGSSTADGTVVKVGDTIRLEMDAATPIRRLHSHANIKSPLTNQGEVTIYGGTDSNDNWIIEIKDKASGSEINYNDKAYFTHVNTKNLLHSHLGYGGGLGKKLEYTSPSGASGYQEVTTLPGKSNNSLWTIQNDWKNVPGKLKNISVKSTPSISATTSAVDTPLINENALIAIKDNASGKYLCTNETDMILKATGTSSNKPECQFKILKKDKLFGFKSEIANNNNLQSNPIGTLIKFNNKNFLSYEFWTLSGQLEKVKILSNASKKYLAVSGETVISDATGSEFTIEIISLQPSDFPAPYVCITPKAQLDEIAMGCKDGKLEIWAIDENNKVYRFNESAGAPYTMPGTVIDPWEIQELKDEIGKVIPGLDGICATCDGNLFGIRSDDKTAVKYNWTTKQWVQMQITNAIQIKLEEIAAAKGNEIYAVSTDDIIYKLEKNTWVKISNGSGIAAGIGTDNKSIVIGLSTTGIPYQLKAKKWTQLGTDIELEKVAIGNQNYILGINSEKQLVKWNGKKWTLIPGKTQASIASVDDIAAIPSETTVAIDRFGNTWHNGDDAVNVTGGKVVIKKTTTTTITKAVADKKVSTATKKKAVKKVSSKKTKKVAKKSKATVKKTKAKKAKKAATTKTAKKTKITKAKKAKKAATTAK